MRGSRKLFAAGFYLLLCFTYSMVALDKGSDGYAVAAVCGAWSTGLATFMWGNVRSNGNGG